MRPVPSLETSYPEIRVIPNKERLAANGLTERDLGVYVDILMFYFKSKYVKVYLITIGLFYEHFVNYTPI